MLSNPLSPVAMLAIVAAFAPLEPAPDAVLADVHAGPPSASAAPAIRTEMTVSTAWEQMDVWWAEQGAMLILDAVRPLGSPAAR